MDFVNEIHTPQEPDIRRKLRKVADTVRGKIKSTQSQALTRVGSYALKNFGQSKYARRTFNTIPTSIIANLLKAIINFLILYRLNTGLYWADFCISMLVTVVTAAISPIFYVLAQEREADLMAFSNHFMDQLMFHGVDYLRMWQARSAVIIGFMAILFLSLVDVNSAYLRRCIIEYLISFWVVDKVNQFRDAIFLPVPVAVTREFHPPPKEWQLTKYDIIKIPLKSVKYDTRVMEPAPTRMIEGYNDTKNKRHVRRFSSRTELVSYLQKQQRIKQSAVVAKSTSNTPGTGTGVNGKVKQIGGSLRRVVDDWSQQQSTEKFLVSLKE